MLLSRRHFFFGSLAAPVLHAKKPAPERPNVVLIVAGGLPSWALGSFGNSEIRTPNLDRLAQTGARFQNHSVCSPVAALSRATLMTGRTPMQLGDQDSPSAENSVEKILSGLGYATGTAASGGAPQVLEQQAAGKPFLLTVSCPALHPPYDGVAQKYRDLYAQTRFDSLNVPRTPAVNTKSGKEMFTDVVGNLRKVAAAVTALDDEVAAIHTRLSQRRLLENTLIVFTSTSGALLGRHGLWGGADASEPPNLFEESVTTPLFWSWLGHVPAQSVRPELVSTYDFLPTLCELVEAPPLPGSLCGRSYLLPLTGKPLPKKKPWRTTIFAHYGNTGMARVLRYKLVMRDQGKGPGELYDLVTDPGEKANQYDNPRFLTIRTPMAEHLASWRKTYS